MVIFAEGRLNYCQIFFEARAGQRITDQHIFNTRDKHDCAFCCSYSQILLPHEGINLRQILCVVRERKVVLLIFELLECITRPFRS